MKTGSILGSSIPRFAYDSPTKAGNDFYTLCDDPRPLAVVFLPVFHHPITREYLSNYLRTLPQLHNMRLACVVRSHPNEVSKSLAGHDFPFPIICDASGVLYAYFNVQPVSGMFQWSFAARRIYKQAKYHPDKETNLLLPLTLAFGREGKVLYARYGHSLTDMPEDCAHVEAIWDILNPTALSESALGQLDLSRTQTLNDLKIPGLDADETSALPDMKKRAEEEEDAFAALFS